MFYSVEKIINNEAILIDDKCNKTVILISKLPKNIKIGNILKQDNGKFILDKIEEKNRREKISSLHKKLFK